MNDYTFLEEMGRKIGDWGREIVQGGYTAGGADNRRGRGAVSMRGRGSRGGRGMAGGGKIRSKRDVLKMQLDFRDIEMELLPTGMERRILNQSTWDFKNKTALFTVEFKFHPPPDPLAGPAEPQDQPFVLLTHRNPIDKTLLATLQSQVADRSKSKKGEPVTPWLKPLVIPEPNAPDAFTPPTCVMRTSLDPLASLSAHGSTNPRPGHIICEGYYQLDPAQTLASVLKHKSFVEFPTIEIWEDGAFHGAIVDDQGALLGDTEEPRQKRQKLSAGESRKAMSGLLGGYGSEEDGEDAEERNIMDLLGGYAGSDDDEEGQQAEPAPMASEDDGLGDEDAEGETDDELEAQPEDLVALLEQLRQAGALRDPRTDGHFTGLVNGEDERVDWGDSGGEDEV